jgi:hypothetical protein
MSRAIERLGQTLDFLRARKRNYMLTFNKTQPAVQETLIDLAKFCRANETCFHEDPRLHAVLEGRREVWLRIQQHLDLSSEQLLALYGGKQFHVQEIDE